MSDKDGGPAFPKQGPQDGMSLRDWFAGQALPACLAFQLPEMQTHGHDVVIRAAASQAYQAADAMLAARDAKEGEK